jgi:hypothetical protein
MQRSARAGTAVLNIDGMSTGGYAPHRSKLKRRWAVFYAFSRIFVKSRIILYMDNMAAVAR